MIEFLQGLTSELVVAAVVGVAGYIINRTIKRNEEARAAQEKLNKINAESKLNEAIDEMKKVSNNVKALSDTITTLSLDVKQLQASDLEQNRIIRNIANTNRINGQCTSELAQLVMTLAEGMRDQHLDGNITKAIDTYRKFESKTLSTILTGNQYTNRQLADPPEQDDTPFGSV